MSMKIKLHIKNLDRTIEMEVGQNIREALLENEINIYSPLWKVFNCQGHGTCGTCRIDVVEGADVLNDKHLYESIRVGGGNKNRRLACQTRVYGDATIETLVPAPEVSTT